MKFIISDYEKLLFKLRNNSYQFINYDEREYIDYSVILRHDIDVDLDKALKMAKVENQYHIKSTYFVLVSTDFYNVHSKSSYDKINGIIKLGHEIGLHFDEKRYESLLCPLLNKKDEYANKIIELVNYEAKILSDIINKNITVVSMHRPSKFFMEFNLKIPNMFNSYDKDFFHDFKYISDSRRQWKEDVESIVDLRQYKHLNILTHPIWYNQSEMLPHDILLNLCNDGKVQRFESLSDNIRDLDEFLTKEDLV